MGGTLFERMTEAQGDRAHARAADPDTSHEAAEVATLAIERQRTLVKEYALTRGSTGFVDVELEQAYPDESPSGLRSRRSELVERNIVLDSGMRRTFGESTNIRIVWRYRDFHPGAPPVCEPAPRATAAHRQAGRDKALEVERWADQMKREGRTLFAQSLTDTAELLRILSRSALG